MTVKIYTRTIGSQRAVKFSVRDVTKAHDWFKNENADKTLQLTYAELFSFDVRELHFAEQFFFKKETLFNNIGWRCD
jgi:hypothetical protein